MTQNIVIDTETALSLTGLAQPPLACLTWATRSNGQMHKGILNPFDGAKQMRRWLESSDVRIIGHHVQYDTAGLCAEFPDLLPLMFRAYREGRIVDTLLREKLKDLSRGLLGTRKAGHYSLANLVREKFNVDLDKTTWRHGYGRLIGVPLSEWPRGAVDYAVDDAVYTLRLYEHQGHVADDAAQSRTGFVFQLMKAWGMRTDPDAVHEAEEQLTEKFNHLRQQLIYNRDAVGRSVLRSDGSRDTAFIKELVTMSYPGGQPPKTETGQVSMKADVVAECSHPFLAPLKDYSDIDKVLSTFIPVVKRGIHEPICPDINTLVRNGRSSYRNPNLQNLPRKGSIRECFVPRPGKVFVDADYDSLEVRTFAQVLRDMGMGCTLMQAYQRNPDFDPHTRLAAQLLGISEGEALQRKAAGDKVLKATRQRAKISVFGFPGGMGARSFISYAKGFGIKLSIQEAEHLKENWKRSIPEVTAYFKWVSSKTRDNQLATVQQLRSGRMRGGCMYTDLANTMWSGLAADGVKRAVFDVAEACYTNTNSVMYGARPVVFIHDELILEADEERGHEVGVELSRLMTQAMEKYTPDVPSRASPQLMRRWYKDAEPAFDQHGRLVPWEPS